MRSYVSTNIETFREDNFNFNKDFQTQNEIIRRYDEVLSQKASNLKINTKVKEASDKLLAKIKETEEFSLKLNNDIVGTNKKLDEFKTMINDEITNQFQILSKTQKKLGSKNQGHGGSSLTSETVDNIKRLMAQKADKSEIDTLYQLKGNKIDSENMLDVQTIMSK